MLCFMYSSLSLGNKSELTLTSTVSQAVQDVSFVAQALKAARVVDACVITGSLKGALINV